MFTLPNLHFSSPLPKKASVGVSRVLSYSYAGIHGNMANVELTYDNHLVTQMNIVKIGLKCSLCSRHAPLCLVGTPTFTWEKPSPFFHRNLTENQISALKSRNKKKKKNLKKKNIHFFFFWLTFWKKILENFQNQ